MKSLGNPIWEMNTTQSYGSSNKILKRTLHNFPQTQQDADCIQLKSSEYQSRVYKEWQKPEA
jgi:hypothetical protein